MTEQGKPLTTLHIDLGREWRGGQRQVYLLTTGLAARGHETHVVTPVGSPLARRLKEGPVKVHEIRFLGEWDFLAALRLARLANGIGAQVVAAHDSHGHGLAALARRFCLRAKLVVHRRVDNPIGGGMFNRGKYAAPTAYIAISEAVKKALIAGGVPAGKISVVSSAVPAATPVEGAKAALARQHKLDDRLPWVGVIAGLVEHKGHRFLLDAWAKICAQGIQAELVIVGNGPLREALAAQIASHRLERSAHLVDWQPDPAPWLAALDVFAMTSVTEGLCTAILDAMAARVPVVATAAGGIPELVRHEETGWLAPVRDVRSIAEGLAVLLTNRRLAASLAARAYDEVWQVRSVEAMVEATLGIYQSASA
jgi:glycosyltransferase involved in cell wall biosynthesis